MAMVTVMATATVMAMATATDMVTAMDMATAMATMMRTRRSLICLKDSLKDNKNSFGVN